MLLVTVFKNTVLDFMVGYQPMKDFLSPYNLGFVIKCFSIPLAFLAFCFVRSKIFTISLLP